MIRRRVSACCAARFPSSPEASAPDDGVASEPGHSQSGLQRLAAVGVATPAGRLELVRGQRVLCHGGPRS